MNVNDLTITSLETFDGFDIATGAYKFTLDELQDATISNTEGTEDVTGKQGRLLSRLKKNKGVTISGNNGMISGGLLEMQTGSEFENTTTEVMWTDYLTVSDNSATTNFTAVGTDGAEIAELYVKDANGFASEELTQGSTASSGVFAYDPSTKALTFSGIDDNTEIVVFYKRKITADVLTNESDTYSTKCSGYLNAMAEDKCANVYRIQFYFPKLDFSGEFDLEFGDSQSVHAFEAVSLAGACGANGSLWTYTVFGVNTEDAA